MDSGVVSIEFSRNQFGPSAPLLPEEVCWIMDRMFAAEVSDPLHLFNLAALKPSPHQDVMAFGQLVISERLHLSIRA
jgi:Mak10 subunit, NatC N(alpha)-terminal acetyltransferase